jgi:hypothetical protein
MPNRVRFDGSAKRFYEVWYTIFNDLGSGDGFWIRYTLLNPLDDHPKAGAALWFGYTCKADPSRSMTSMRTFPAGSFEASPGADRVRIDRALLEPGIFRGAFTEGGHEVAWDLAYEPSAEAHHYFGPLLRRLTARRTSVTIPNPRILLSGEITIDDRSLTIRNAPGHQAHHWGAQRAPRWIWGHCCAFEDDSTVLEVLAAEGPAGITVTFVNLWTAEGALLCNGADGVAYNRSSSGLGWWQFEGWKGREQVVAEVRVDPRHVAKFLYTSPDYATSECWNTQVGDCLVRWYGAESGGRRLRRVLRAHGTAAAEVHDERPERIAYRAWVSENE